MKKKSLFVLTYNVPHRKTYDTLCLLRAKGYNEITVFAQPMTYVKKHCPLIIHRPELNASIPSTSMLCKNLGYDYIEGEFNNAIGAVNDRKESLYLLCGAGLLPKEFITSHRIINSHPGYIPLARGLDAYKWSVYKGIPIGVTTHFLGKYVDAGEVIERREIKIREFDTFHSVAQRIYENEINMLVGAINRSDDEHIFIIPDSDSEIFKRMPEGKERKLFGKFEAYKKQNSLSKEKR